MNEMYRVLKKGGRLLIYVMAFEQDKKKYDTQDELVKFTHQTKDSKKTVAHNAMRYYHLYKENELIADALELGWTLTDQFFDTGNWAIVVEKLEESKPVPMELNNVTQEEKDVNQMADDVMKCSIKKDKKKNKDKNNIIKDETEIVQSKPFGS